jgi:hypothetical protein
MKIFAAALLCLTASATAQESGAQNSSIAWYGTWEQGLAEAKRLDLPILLHSAAPRCGGVPGMW